MLAAPRLLGQTLPTQYSISWSERKRKYNYSQMAANFREERTSITTIGAKTQAFDIFSTPLISHYPLPLKGSHLSFLKKKKTFFRVYWTESIQLWTLLNSTVIGSSDSVSTSYRGRIQRKHVVWEPMPEMTITSPYVTTTHVHHRKPYAKVDLNPYASQLYPPVRVFEFGLWMQEHLRFISQIDFVERGYTFMQKRIKSSLI